MSVDYFTDLPDEDVEDIGMYRCACGEAVYPTGDPDWRHCALDRPVAG